MPDRGSTVATGFDSTVIAMVWVTVDIALALAYVIYRLAPTRDRARAYELIRA